MAYVWNEISTDEGIAKLLIVSSKMRGTTELHAVLDRSSWEHNTYRAI